MKTKTKTSTNSSDYNAYQKGDILYINTPRKEWVPGYVYYLIEKLNQRDTTLIKRVCFTVDGVYMYDIDRLKGKKVWLDVGGENE